MKQEFKCYTYICDNCGVDLHRDADVSGWSDEDYLEEVKGEGDWITDNGKDYCSYCYRYDDNDKLIIDGSRKDKYKSE